MMLGMLALMTNILKLINKGYTIKIKGRIYNARRTETLHIIETV